MSKAVIFPEYVDTLPQFLFLESDDISIFIFGMIVGVILQYASRSPVGMMAGIVLGVWLSYQYVKLPGTLVHMVYALTGLFPLNDRYPNGLTKRVDN